MSIVMSLKFIILSVIDNVKKRKGTGGNSKLPEQQCKECTNVQALGGWVVHFPFDDCSLFQSVVLNKKG